ncbi:hypothetical protein EG68_11811 [Paragonimus skrjabini miyazakii]|uniref:Uncharacterized protein n=1 Tax=Paragonimus skrjabini miyazakii TaxID=59628 RepID=A0A8S9YIA8_9TREM|nr:hypothetical protein EG68_11811 [Paragonimus skrjabini miyazakii]
MDLSFSGTTMSWHGMNNNPLQIWMKNWMFILIYWTTW